MRVLITCVGAYGHLHPLVPLAQALRRAGHEVALATGLDVRSRVEAAGFTARQAGLGMDQAFERLAERHPDQEYDRLAPGEILDWYAPHLFGEVLAPAMLDDLEPLVQSLRPDVIVHDTWELAGPIAAASAGIPSISHTLGPRFADRVVARVSAAVASLWRQRGLAPDPTAGLYRHICLDITPPSLRPSRQWTAEREAARPLRPVAQPALPGERLPKWIGRRATHDRPQTTHGRREFALRSSTDDGKKVRSSAAGGRSLAEVPLVYMTMGTNTNTDTDVFRSVTEGLGGHELEVLITLGPGRDPGALGPVANNVHVESYVPQSLLLPHCSAVVCHGGAGTTLNALELGLPILALPRGADQYIVSDLMQASGAGLLLKPSEVSPAAVRSGVLALLHEPEYRAAAARVRQEIAAMPSPEETVRLIESLSYVKLTRGT